MNFPEPRNISNLSKNTVIASNALLAATPVKRMAGLLARKDFKKGEALIIRPCKQVHTFFMRFPIDVLFVDKKNKVIAAVENLKPFRLSPFYFNANLAVELPAGIIKSTGTSKGDLLQI